MQEKILFESIVDQILAKNFAVIHGLIDQSTLQGLYDQLLSLNDKHQFAHAGIGAKSNFKQNGAIRSDQIHWLDEQSNHTAERKFFELIDGLRRYLNRTCYTGIHESEFHYARFETGAFYKRHIDRFSNDNARKFSVITYLNPNWIESDGGELVLYLKEETITIEPVWGRTVIFPSHFIEHEVLPSTRTRLSLTGWLK